MLTPIKKVLLFGIAGCMTLVAFALAFVDGLFVWQTYDQADANFAAPSGRWSLQIEVNGLSGSCFKHASVVVRDGWFPSHELQCDMGATTTRSSIVLPASRRRWRIDLRNDCYITAAFRRRQSWGTVAAVPERTSSA